MTIWAILIGVVIGVILVVAALWASIKAMGDDDDDDIWPGGLRVTP